MTTKEHYPLQDRWVLWNHKVDSDDWTINGYKKLLVLESLEDYYKMLNSVEDISAGMFFLMKEGIEPLWEDPANIKGGFWSFRVSKNKSKEIWANISAALVGQTLTQDPSQMQYVNGISFSPKISKAIFRIWINDSKKNNIKKMISNDMDPNIDTSDALWKRYKK